MFSVDHHLFYRGYLALEQEFDLMKARTNADPYVAAGVYSHVDVRPFRPVLP